MPKVEEHSIVNKPKIAVLWQSLVVPEYRSFFYHLRDQLDADMTLIAPDKFRELGGQTVRCAPEPKQRARIQLKILPAITIHTQIVWFRGLWRVLQSLFRPREKREKHFLCVAEPYAPTSLFAYLALRLSARDVKFYTYGLQNIVKRLPWPLRAIQTFLFRRCTAILTSGREQEEVLRAHGYRGPCLSFPLWFDGETYALLDQTKARQQLRQIPGHAFYQTGNLTVGYVGSLIEQKGITDLLAALSKIEGWKNQLDVVIVGRGPQLPEILAEVAQLRRDQWNVQVPGALAPEHLRIFYSACDILVVPSRTAHNWKEQFGRVIVEAEACGCLALGSTSGAIPEVIDDPQRIFREHDSNHLAQTLEAALSRLSSSDRKEFRTTVHRRAVDRFSDAVLATQFAEKLKSRPTPSH